MFSSVGLDLYPPVDYSLNNIFGHVTSAKASLYSHMVAAVGWLRTSLSNLRGSSTGQIQICIKYQNFLELLMGRNYASLTLSYSWEGFMQNMPRVTHGEELCKVCSA